MPESILMPKIPVNSADKVAVQNIVLLAFMFVVIQHSDKNARRTAIVCGNRRAFCILCLYSIFRFRG